MRSDISNKEGGGILALLDLPAGSTVTLDGETVMLQRDDFVGFRDLPSPGAGGLHLVTVRAGNNKSGDRRGAAISSATTVGFIVDGSSLIRRYDPATEEVSSLAVDERTSVNLLRQIGEGNLDWRRLVPYQNFIAEVQLKRWKGLTNFVSNEILERRGIGLGAKLIPGAFCDGDDEPGDGGAAPKIVDGSSVRYPPVPYLLKSTIHHATSHSGTKRFMAALSPGQRTAFFMADQPATMVLDYVLAVEYDNQYRQMMGDIQLSYVLFLHLHCIASLNHWRDLVALLSGVPTGDIAAHSELYADFFRVIFEHVKTMDDDFVDEVEFSGDNFLVPALQRLLHAATKCQVERTDFGLALDRLQTLLGDKFPDYFADNDDEGQEKESSKMETERINGIEYPFEDAEDEDTPVVVPFEEVHASMARVSEMAGRRGVAKEEQQYDPSIRKQYPLLFAAMDSTSAQEDVVMTCARALYDANDVSLVREAAAYLAEVEAKKM